MISISAEQAVLSLPEPDRAQLAYLLLDSLDATKINALIKLR